jgi:tetratricopeptide (TPR) repeat protein
MGLAEELNGNIDAALVWYASVPAQSHRFDAAQTQYINLLADRGQIDKAREHLKLMRHEQPQRALQYYLFEAGFLREQGLSQAAFDLLTEALEQYPQNNEALYSRAMVAESLDKLDVLEADLRMILAKEPDNAQALNALGYTLTDRTNRHQEALQLINRALELQPGDPFYLDSLGWVYYRLGDLEKAEKYLREAMQIQPDVEFISHLGEVLWEQGKKDEAMQIWQQGIKQDADNKLLRETMRRYGK